MSLLDQYGNKLTSNIKKIGFALQGGKKEIKRTFNDWAGYGNTPKHTKVSITNNAITNFIKS